MLDGAINQVDDVQSRCSGLVLRGTSFILNGDKAASYSRKASKALESLAVTFQRVARCEETDAVSVSKSGPLSVSTAKSERVCMKSIKIGDVGDPCGSPDSICRMDPVSPAGNRRAREDNLVSLIIYYVRA